MICPECGSECERDMVDVGIGEIPSGPWGCPECHWVDRSAERESMQILADIEARNRDESEESKS